MYGLSSRRPGFDPGAVRVTFVLDKVTVGQVFLRILQVFPVSIFPQMLYIPLHPLLLYSEGQAGEAWKR